MASCLYTGSIVMAPLQAHVLTVPLSPECAPTTVSEWPHPRLEGSAQCSGHGPEFHLHRGHELPAHDGVLPPAQVLLGVWAWLCAGSPREWKRSRRGSEGAQKAGSGANGRGQMEGKEWGEAKTEITGRRGLGTVARSKGNRETEENLGVRG